ncbi:hypothetical protein A3C32_04260 [Candidatus Daviesbacteria bacterium RIFCSPHIGHO2_02_FULL_41_14]|uniref:Glycosyltransferase 2-like domain-containing protein n=1 Tax=Candidatus Daviesbacteria bacterium RIFCSPLOWO2_01_FULL_40_24 TaxID=1797787 RepID=A0A1F5MJG4_9BACT|nr:MAG: hypothetical protein A3C32_04260 [Candidatus Daviesbacteria bacterium RIFCSPHIGHO2_02_FULL_41_14]OGE65440.1 MAG: hypothetical protein A3B49_00955 [Candidatus Daviesbacteria bacterium RIFCSPLOWO2_01_FULL_40_24]
MSSSGRLVSVIIPTYNSWNTLQACIKSIYQQSLKPLEIIVVNNASTDNTTKKITKDFPQVKFMTLNYNLGVTGGRNIGIDQSSKRSDYLLFFDHDMVADKKMLENLVAAVKSNKAVGITTPKIYYNRDRKRIWAAGTNINLWTGQILFRGGRDVGQYEKIEEVQVAPAAILVKRAVLKKVTRFDNRYFATYEDTDFCFRAKKNGFVTLYSPNAIAYHNISPLKKDERVRLISRSFWIGRNRVIFMRDFGKNFYIFLFFSPVYLIYFAVICFKEKNFTGFMQFCRGYMEGVTSPRRYGNILKTNKDLN